MAILEDLAFFRSGTHHVVGVTRGGDIPCQAANVATRTDTDEAMNLLSRLPRAPLNVLAGRRHAWPAC